MSLPCLCCHKTDGELRDGYHPECSKALFDSETPPKIPFDTPEIAIQARKMLGRMSVSGVQPKISVVHDRKNRGLAVVETGGEYILKPQTDLFPQLPENENLCMNIASAFGIEVPPHGLVQLADGRFAYVVKRFDRINGKKRHQEDFQQLLEKDDKYDGSHEQIAKFVKAHSTDPDSDLVKLFERSLLFFVIGNGDAHLKNFSLVLTEAGHRLSPAYDIVNSRLVLPDEREELCLSVQGKRNKIGRKVFVDFGLHLGIDDKQAEHVFERLSGLKGYIERQIEESLLTSDLKGRFLEIYRERMERVFE